MEMWIKILIWTGIFLALSSLWGLFMAGFTAGLMGAYVPPTLVLIIAVNSFLNPPLSTVWIIGILYILIREIQRIEKEIPKPT